MSPSRPQRRKRHAHALHVPVWYYVGLAVAAVVGIVLIVLGTQVRMGGITTEGDYFAGSAEAEVTIIEWGSFG